MKVIAILPTSHNDLIIGCNEDGVINSLQSFNNNIKSAFFIIDEADSVIIIQTKDNEYHKMEIERYCLTRDKKHFIYQVATNKINTTVLQKFIFDFLKS